jgi:hypothetical protein
VTALVVRGRPAIGVTAAIVLTLGVTFVGKTTSWDPFASFWFEAYDNVAAALQAVPETRAVDYDLGFLDPDARNLYEFRFAPRQLTFVDDACGAVPGHALISSSDLGRVGVVAAPIAADSLLDQGLWLVEETIPVACRRR